MVSSIELYENIISFSGLFCKSSTRNSEKELYSEVNYVYKECKLEMTEFFIINGSMQDRI